MRHAIKTIFMLLFSFLFFACQQPKMEDNSAKNKKGVLMIYKAFNDNNPALLDEYVSENANDHAIDTSITKKQGLAGLKEILKVYKTSFPDLMIKSNAIAASGDTVISYYTYTGTNSGPIMGMPATNRSVKVNGVDIVIFKDGKAIEHWEVQDQIALMKQLGMMQSEQNMKNEKQM
jgi:predicted ester cyclase